MDTTSNKEPIDRRGLLVGVGGLGLMAALGARLAAALSGAGAATPAGTPPAAPATPGAGTPVPAAWTPPQIPQPLPTVGGVAPTVVGAAPPPAATPFGNQPMGQATPVAHVESPGGPPQLVAQRGTPVAAMPTPAVTVTLTPDFRFDPAAVTIKVGQAVRWVNAGRSPQTVTADPARAKDASLVALPSGARPWDSGVLNAGDDYVRVFDVPGDYVYFSIPQEQAGMVGRVVVQG